MNAREQAGALLRAVGRGMGIDLALDDAGACGLRIDGRVDLTLRVEEVAPAILVYAVVGVLPNEPQAALRWLLTANHLWEGSRGATWSVSDDDVVLARLIPLVGLEVEVLANELARFADVAFAGQKALAVKVSGAVVAPAQTFVPPPFGMA